MRTCTRTQVSVCTNELQFCPLPWSSLCFFCNSALYCLYVFPFFRRLYISLPILSSPRCRTPSFSFLFIFVCQPLPQASPWLFAVMRGRTSSPGSLHPYSSFHRFGYVCLCLYDVSVAMNPCVRGSPWREESRESARATANQRRKDSLLWSLLSSASPSLTSHVLVPSFLFLLYMTRRFLSLSRLPTRRVFSSCLLAFNDSWPYFHAVQIQKNDSFVCSFLYTSLLPSLSLSHYLLSLPSFGISMHLTRF